MTASPEAAAPILAAITARLGEGDRRPLVTGICGAQGSGKSTVCDAVAASLSSNGRRVAVLSLDDLYLPRAQRERLAADVHPLLLTRGVPGTHDVAHGLRVLAALGQPGRVVLPRFSKADDDPVPPADRDTISAPVDVILFEGWCVGALPQRADALARPVNALEAQEDADGRWRRYVNQRLATDYRALFGMVDLLVLLAAPGFEVVRRWRGEQEANLRLAAGTRAAHVMDARALDRFVDHYERLTRHILAEMPARADLVLCLDDERRVTRTAARC